MNPDIIIIGAGPVGLWTAIQAKLYKPGAQILIFEKYPTYQRKHVLIVNKSSFKDSYTENERFNQIKTEMTGKISTLELEEKLLTFAQEIGIEIQYEHITDLENLTQRYPKTTVIVGADGARSSVRKEIFNDELSTFTNLQSVVEMKYFARGEVRPLGKRETFALISYCGHFISETVGKRNDQDLTPITLRMFVEKWEYEKLKLATFRDPYHLNEKDKFPHAVYADFIRWVLARETLLKEARVPSSDKISSLQLNAYRSKEFVKLHLGKTWCLVGDAAMGFPFFRALNDGLLLGNCLAKALAGVGKPMSLDAFLAYQNYAAHLGEQEISATMLKSFALDSCTSVAGVGRDVSTKGVWRVHFSAELRKALALPDPMLPIQAVEVPTDLSVSSADINDLSAIQSAVNSAVTNYLSPTEAEIRKSACSACQKTEYGDKEGSHGPWGQLNAERFQSQVKKAHSAQEAWALILKRFENGPGGWGKRSFKTKLIENLLKHFDAVANGMDRSPEFNMVDAIQYTKLMIGKLAATPALSLSHTV